MSTSEKSTSEKSPAYDPKKYRKKHLLFGTKSSSSTSSEEKEKREADLRDAAVKRKADLIAEKHKADLIAEKRKAEANHKADLKAAAKKRKAIRKMINDVSKILDFFKESDIKSITKDYNSQLEAYNEFKTFKTFKTESLDSYISNFIQLKTYLEGLLIQDQISVDLKDLNQHYSRLLPNLESLQEQISNIENSFNYLYNINFIHLLWGKIKLFDFLNESTTKDVYIDETKFIQLFVDKSSLMLKTPKKSNNKNNKTKKRTSNNRPSNNRPSNGL